MATKTAKKQRRLPRRKEDDAAPFKSEEKSCNCRITVEG